ncbi:MAG: T9SS type A sorting domain-containing protein [Opitutaceae bacterium]|nr:T9SS type A sorting domain-containing protein [Cytophagales bacterium]
MRKIYILLLAFYSFPASSQVIPNNNFENWISDTQLNDWTVGNAGILSFYNAPSTISKSINKFSGSYALKIQNSKGSYINKFGTKVDTIFGGLVTTDVSIKGKSAPGYLKGHINYSLAAGETAEISISYKYALTRGFRTRLEAIKQFTGSSGGVYVPFTLPINQYYHPDRFSDTLFITISTFKFENSVQRAVSEQSNIVIDSLGFVGIMPAIEVPAIGTVLNGGFESWSNIEGNNIPDNWHFYGTSAVLRNTRIEQTTDFHSGKLAAKMSIDHVNDPGVLYTFSRATTESKYLNGYAKFNLSASAKDTVSVTVFKFSKRQFGDKIFASKDFAGQSSYQPFSIKLDNTVMPNDTLMIFYYFLNRGVVSPEVSTFQLDDVSISSNPLGFEEETNAPQYFTVTPNPSQSGIFVLNGYREIKDFKVYNSEGTETIAQFQHSPDNIVIDLSNNPRGMYFIHSELNGQYYKLVY